MDIFDMTEPKYKPDMLEITMHKKIQEIIDEYYLASGKYVTIRGTIHEKEAHEFCLRGGPAEDTICKLVLSEELNTTLEVLLKSLHDREIDRVRHRIESAKNLLKQFKDHLGINEGPEDALPLMIRFGDIREIINKINKDTRGRYLYMWPDKIYLEGECLGSAGGNMIYLLLNIVF